MQFQIDPKIPFWFGVWTSILMVIAQGTIKFPGVPAEYATMISGYAFDFATINGIILTAMTGISSAARGPLVGAAIPPAAKMAIAFFAIGVALTMLTSPATAAEKMRPMFGGQALTGNPVNDIKSAVEQTTSSALPTCDFNTFTILTPANVVAQLQACGEKLLTDSQAALASAKAANDNIATSCLTPSTALVQAAIGTPAVPATEATATSPAVPATPAQLPGPVLIFQKFREFVNNGGITNCKAWVNNTVTAATASGL